LHHLIGNDASRKEYLSRVVEDEYFDERNRTTPSGQLRRYVTCCDALKVSRRSLHKHSVPSNRWKECDDGALSLAR
jgi:hypothetical protein